MKNTLMKWIYLGVVMVAGAVFGSLFIQLLSNEQIASIGQEISDYTIWIDKQGEQLNTALFWDVFFINFIWVALIFVMGLSVVGVPVIIVMLFIKGFIVGSTIHLMLESMGANSVIAAVASQIPHMILAIPALLCISSAAISFTTFALKKRKGQAQWKEQFVSYSTITMSMMLILALSAWVEVKVTPVVLDWAISVVVI